MSNEKEEVIRVLDFPENVRAKWGMYIDSANSCLREILDNATDESFVSRSCDNIVVDTDFNGYNLVADNGRGIPISMSVDRPEQTQADVSISVLHSGSKFVATGTATVGTHGVGSACANALSERYILMSRITRENYNRSVPAVREAWKSSGPRSRGDLYYYVEYRKGYKVAESAGHLPEIEGYLFGDSPKGYRQIPAGYSTIVLFRPDPEIWGSVRTDLPIQNIRNFLLIQEKFYGRRVTVIANGEVMNGPGFTPYRYEILRSIAPADPSANPEVKVYLTFEIDKESLGPKNTEASMNGLTCSSGIHLQYAESAFETALREEYKIRHRLLTPGLRMFALFLADDVQYSGQTKERCKSITKVKATDFADLVKDFRKIFRSDPEYWESHAMILNSLAESLKNLTATEKAGKLQVGTATTAGLRVRAELSDKLVDATAGPSDRWDCELFLCEGESAGGSLVKSRRGSKYHAVMKLRGRVLNVDGADVDQMLENKEFYTIFRAIGLGLDCNFVGSDAGSPEEAYEAIRRASRYGKIIISTDEDSDGEAIRNGLTYAFSRFARFLIDFGMVYIVESPFWEQAGKYYYPSDPVVPGTEYPVGLDMSKPFKRFKGLGSLNPGEIYDAFFNPATRRLTQVTSGDIEYAQELVENVESRRNLLIRKGILTNPYGL